MAAFGWKQETSVADWLFAEPWEFDFFQAVRLLELLYHDRTPPGEGFSPAEEVVRFRSTVTQVFAASEVQALSRPAAPGEPAEMSVNLASLGGATGPLPAEDSERVIERSWRKDFAGRDFLDLFHHRLLSLLVGTRKAHHPSYTALTPFEGPIAQYLYAFFGLAPATLHDRMRMSDRALVFYSGILSQHPRSASGLEQLLGDYFAVPAKVIQLLGQWRQLEPNTWTLIGPKGRNRALGAGAILGTRVWDQQGRFEVRLGPMPLRTFLDLLPRGSGFEPLCQLTRFYTGPDLEFGFRLTVKAADVPESRLGQSWLGWTSWLKTRPFPADDSQVRLASRTPADPFARSPMDTLV
jgi:type VI secretion system protein ImpH